MKTRCRSYRPLDAHVAPPPETFPVSAVSTYCVLFPKSFLLPDHLNQKGGIRCAYNLRIRYSANAPFLTLQIVSDSPCVTSSASSVDDL
ncbi:hypothetical protein STEG23_028528 [Scotinomys teguina]